MSSGFSIIEILVIIFILVLIGVAVAKFQADVFSLNTVLSNSLTAQGEAWLALKTMSVEIRSASPSSTGAYPILEATSLSFIFYNDRDNDQLKERIRYFLDNTTLRKGIIEPSGNPLTYNSANEIISDLVHDVANGGTAIFNYYDRNYDGQTLPLGEPVDIAAVRLVKITVIIDRDPSRPPSPITLTTQISMRNLKDNL